MKRKYKHARNRSLLWNWKVNEWAVGCHGAAGFLAVLGETCTKQKRHTWKSTDQLVNIAVQTLLHENVAVEERAFQTVIPFKSTC